MNSAVLTMQADRIEICGLSDLIPDSGICALLPDGRQVALFHLSREGEVRAIDNFDPIGQANVLSRGIPGDMDGVPVVASPLYKQHFSLIDGRCLEDAGVCVAVYPVHLEGERVILDISGQTDVRE